MHKKIVWAALFLLFFSCSLFAQKPVVLWHTVKTNVLKGYGKLEEVILDAKSVEEVYNNNIPFIELAIRDRFGMSHNVLLAETRMSDIKVKINNREYLKDVAIPKLFRGKIKSLKQANDVLLTIAPGYVSFTAYLPAETITLEPDSRKAGSYVLLNSADRQYKTLPFQCGLPDAPPEKKNGQQISTVSGNSLTPFDKCNFVFVDCTNRLFINRGSNVQNTVNYVYSIWNGVRTAFINEQLNVFISEINVWTIADPFDVSSTTTVANKSFADFYQNNYWGNMAMLLDWSMLNAAIAGGYGWAKAMEPNSCGNYVAAPVPAWNVGSFIYNNINPAVFSSLSYSNFPAAAIAHQVYISVHELGHLFNSWHTHSCNWPGGPIDNCVAIEGPCTPTGVIPAGGGTFMSYCSQVAAGVNFNNGFGTLPGNAIRLFVGTHGCIASCNACVTNDVVGNIFAPGFIQKEAYNQIIANGTLNAQVGFIKLDAGTRVVLQDGFRVMEGSKVQVIIDGCGGIR